MKKLLIIAIVFLCCCTGSVRLDEQLVQDYILSSDYKDCERYSKGMLDSSFCQDYDRALSDSLVAMANLLSKKSDSVLQGYFYNAPADATGKAEKMIKQSKRLMLMNDSVIANAQKVFCGYEKTVTLLKGPDTINLLFRMDKELTRITEVVKL